MKIRETTKETTTTTKRIEIEPTYNTSLVVCEKSYVCMCMKFFYLTQVCASVDRGIIRQLTPHRMYMRTVTGLNCILHWGTVWYDRIALRGNTDSRTLHTYDVRVSGMYSSQLQQLPFSSPRRTIRRGFVGVREELKTLYGTDSLCAKVSNL